MTKYLHIEQLYSQTRVGSFWDQTIITFGVSQVKIINTVTRVNNLHPPKVMIWVGIGANFMMDIIFF